jgi:site-specific DNA-methyltransferase (adenine-specific)
MRSETIGNAKLYLGDCRDVPIDPVDAVISDPPYGITANKWDQDIAEDALWRFQSEVYVLTASQPFTAKMVVSKLDWFRHEWIWIKNRGSNFANTVREPMKEHESVLVFAPSAGWTYNKQMQDRTGGGADRVDYGVAFRSQSENYRAFEGRDATMLPKERVPSSWQKFNCEVGLHPTQKPVPLFEYLVRTYSNQGNLILDPFVGSGTTGVASIREGRTFIGIERDPAYFDIACRRIEDAQRQGSLFGTAA